MSLQDLPPELHLKIVDNLGYYDRKSIRQSCKSLQYAVDRLDPTPNDIILHYNTDSLLNARETIQHTKNAAIYTKLVLHANPLASGMHYTKWERVRPKPWLLYYYLPRERAVQAIASVVSHSHRDDREETLRTMLARLEAAYAHHVGNTDLGDMSPHESCSLSAVAKRAMKAQTGLPDFPQSALIACYHKFGKAQYIEKFTPPVLSDALRIIMQKCCNLNELHFLLGNAADPQRNPPYVNAAYRDCLAIASDSPCNIDNLQGRASLSLLLRAARDAKLAPRILHVEGPDPSCMSVIDANTWTTILRNVESFSWKVATHYPEDRAPEIDILSSIFVEEDGVSKALSAATNLRALTLALYEECNGNIPVSFTTAHLLGDLFWPSLASLKLGKIRINLMFFVRFLTQHCHSLRHLALSKVDLMGGTYEKFFAKFAGKLHGLEDVCLCGEFGYDDGSLGVWYNFAPDGTDRFSGRLQKYIMTGEGVCPAPRGE